MTLSTQTKPAANRYVRFVVSRSKTVPGMSHMLSGETGETFLGRPRSVYFGHYTDRKAAESAKAQCERKHLGKSAD